MILYIKYILKIFKIYMKILTVKCVCFLYTNYIKCSREIIIIKELKAKTLEIEHKLQNGK